VIIGVDAGTTVTKAVLFADDGTPLRRAAESTRLDRAGDGRYEQDAAAVPGRCCSPARPRRSWPRCATPNRRRSPPPPPPAAARTSCCNA
jgi:hypothetical protein